MSVPGRIGLVLIIVLAMVDAIILLSGVHHAATAVETHAMTPIAEPEHRITDAEPAKHEPLLSTALREINLIISKPRERPTGI